MISKKGLDILYNDSLQLLKSLISVESFSKTEAISADIINIFLNEHGVKAHRKFNNVWAYNKFFDDNKPTLLLDSHHDTVKPNRGWTMNPMAPQIKNGKLYGLGSNDAGGALVSMIAAFLYFYNVDHLKYNVAISASAEEEISGSNGVLSILKHLKNLKYALIGEPTGLNMAIAEKGLMVLDCTASGKSGHAATGTGDNAIYKAVKDISWFRNFRFPKKSKYLGEVKMNVTMINAGVQHNVIPAECHFTVDIRLNDRYSHKEILSIVKKNVSSQVKPRSMRLRASSVQMSNEIVKAGLAIGLKTYGSNTCSNMGLINIPSVKIGPGDSKRSHIANEFIYLKEIKQGIKTYIALLNNILLN